jgi:formamidopyrimidine-DNA glycosylase
MPKAPAFRLLFEDGGVLVLTEGGPKKRARVGVYRPDAIELELGHLGPEAFGLSTEALRDVLETEPRRLHALLRDQRALAGIGRAWANEILHHARVSPYALSTDLSDEQIARLSEAIDEELARGLELREAGAGDRKAYRIHNRLDEPCPECATPIARVDFDEHTIFYCPSCQTEGRVLKDRRLSRLLR